MSTRREFLNASENMVCELLDVHPSQLRFLFGPNKLISCPLRLTNKTDDHHVAFRCLPKTPESYMDGLSRLHGILPPRSTCTYVVTMEKQQQLPTNMDAFSIILETCVAHADTKNADDYISRRGQVHEVTLTALCEPDGKGMTSEVS